MPPCTDDGHDDGVLFAAGDHRVARLRAPEDVPKVVAALAERRAGHAFLVRGAPPRPALPRRGRSRFPPGRPGRQEARGRLQARGARGRGLGGALARAFEAWAVGQGAGRVMLPVVEEDRRALRFRRGLGFDVTRKLPQRRFGAEEHARLEMARVPGALPRTREGLARFLDGEGRVTVYPAGRGDQREVRPTSPPSSRRAGGSPSAR